MPPSVWLEESSLRADAARVAFAVNTFAVGYIGFRGRQSAVSTPSMLAVPPGRGVPFEGAITRTSVS